MNTVLISLLILANLIFFGALLTLANWVLETHHKWRFGVFWWSLSFVAAIACPLAVGAASIILGGHILS